MSLGKWLAQAILCASVLGEEGRDCSEVIAGRDVVKKVTGVVHFVAWKFGYYADFQYLCYKKLRKECNLLEMSIG